MAMLGTDIDRPAASLSGLRGIALLQGLDDAVLSEVGAACRFQLVRARQTVMSKADVEHDCCFVLSGQLRVVALSPGGRELSFRDAGAGEMIGEMAALDGRPRSATVVALHESLLARIRPLELKTLLRRHWPICERLLQHLARTARTLTERVYELSALNVQQRLCAELTRLALAADGAANNRVVLRPAPSHHELAMRISSYREQITREITELVHLGVLTRDREQIVIEDLRRLAELGDGGRAGKA